MLTGSTCWRRCSPLRSGRQVVVWCAWMISFFTLATIFLSFDEIHISRVQHLEELSESDGQHRVNRRPQSYEVEQAKEVGEVHDSNLKINTLRGGYNEKLTNGPNENKQNGRMIVSVDSNTNLQNFKLTKSNYDDDDENDDGGGDAETLQRRNASLGQKLQLDESKAKGRESDQNNRCATGSQCNQHRDEGIILLNSDGIKSLESPHSRQRFEPGMRQHSGGRSRRFPDESRVSQQSKQASASNTYLQKQDSLPNNKHNQQKHKAINLQHFKSEMINERDHDSTAKITANGLQVTPSGGSSILSIETQIPTKDGAEIGLVPLHLAPMVEPPATQIQIPDVDSSRSDVVTAWSAGGMPLVEDGVYWTPEVEQLIPKGLTNEEIEEFVAKVSRTRVSSMEPAEWNRCGRPKNQFIRLQDGTALCARYRAPETALLRGEVLSFYLAKMLSVDNVPSVALSVVNNNTILWRDADFTLADWQSGQLVVLIQWIDDLSHDRSRVKMPASLLEIYETGVSLVGTDLLSSNLTAGELSALAQWTDLILLDYLTGHYDRVASMQDGAEREMKPSIMTESIRNLRQVWQTGKLWLIDNESGLLDGYELMYRSHPREGQFASFHRRMLRTICVFRRSTVDGIRRLAEHSSPDVVLESFVISHEPLYRNLPWSSELELFRTYFSTRLKEVSNWTKHCQSKT